MNTTTVPTLLSLGSAFPHQSVTQQEIYQDLLQHWYRDIPNVEALLGQARVRRRFMAWDPREGMRGGTPSLGKRMAVYEREVMEVGSRSVSEALRRQDRERIGSFIMASCTGYMGPTPELLLAKQFNLRPNLRRTFVGHMGCYAAFNVLKVAMDGLAARPDERVLINCTELCSMHFRPEPTREQAVVHALFGDASASAVLGNEEPGAGPQLLRSHTVQLYDTNDLMTWNLLDDGFRMTLSPLVPLLLGEHAVSFVDALVNPAGIRAGDVRYWGIHPGGPKIVETIAQQLGLSDSQLRATWNVLSEYGNCSSPTVLLVLQDMLANDRPRAGEYGVLMAFGPGLTMEGLLVRF